MKRELENNGFKISKKRDTKTGDTLGHIRWYGSAQPDTIKEFIRVWNETVNPNPIDCYILKCDSNLLYML